MNQPPAHTRQLSLREVLPDAVMPSGEIEVSSCCADASSCLPGDLFVALGSPAAEDHHVRQAASRGAKAVLADRPLPDCSLPVCYVDDAAEAFGFVCQALAGHPASRLKSVGVAGADGITTTSCLIGSVLAAGGHPTGVVGALGCFDGREWDDAACATPPANVLAAWMARAAANGCTHAVMEISSHALDQRRTAGIEFDIVCLTNARRDDLDSRGHRHAKARLFEQLAPEGFLIVNIDDPAARGALSQVDGPVLSVGIEGGAEISATPVEQWASEQTFLLEVENETIPVRTSLTGRRNITHCLLAAAVGLVYSIDLATIVTGLEAIQRIPGRLERGGQPALRRAA